MHGLLYRLTGVSLTPSDRIYNKYIDDLSDDQVEELENYIAKTYPASEQRYLDEVKKHLILSIINAQQKATENGETEFEVGKISGVTTPLKSSIDYELGYPDISLEDRCKLTIGFANKLYGVLGNGRRQMNFIYKTSCYDSEDHGLISCSIIGQPVE